MYSRILGVAGLLALALVLLLSPLGNDYRALWFGETTDAGHVVLFALLTFGLAWLIRPGQPLKAALAAAGLSLAAELVQPLVGRSGSWRDLAYGLLGIVIALVWLAPWKWPLRVAATIVLAIWPAVNAGPLLIDAWWAWRSFPVLARFDGPFESRRWLLERAHLFAPRPGSAILEFEPSPRGSGAILFPVVRDWRRYEALEVDFAFDGEPMEFLISVRDGKKLPPELPRFDLRRRYEPGTHHVRIDLAELARGGSFPPIDLSRVQSLHLVAYSDQAHVVELTRIELTGRKTNSP
jgi:hypothetical protein